MVDELAEQSLKLGGQAAGTLAWFKAHTRLGEDEGESILFTPATTFAQAVAAIGGPPYPYSCDGVPRTPDPAPKTTFATDRYLLISYPTWDKLLHSASSPKVVSVDGTPLYPCP
jgi:hypothetical protein